MQSAAQTMFKKAFSVLLRPFLSSHADAKTTVNSKAHRIGPQRVILKIALNDNFEGFDIDRIDVASQQLQLCADSQKNENVSVSLVFIEKETLCSKPTKREHRATLRVQPKTNRLMLTFKDADSEIYKTELIDIE